MAHLRAPFGSEAEVTLPKLNLVGVQVFEGGRPLKIASESAGSVTLFLGGGSYSLELLGK